MPRLVFDNKKQFLNWIKDHVTPSNYEVFITYFGEIIFAPLKSTRTLRYGYINALDIWDSMEEAIKDITKRVPNLRNYRVERFEWTTDRAVGVERRI